ncbi:octopamine receptor beta-2R-like [Exaiptasia diaphana]|nr:octopamine receptor beta-2R-like [Exaiptasia diaphana]
METGTKHVILTTSLVIMQILSIFGNMMLFVVVYRRPSLRTRTNMFILNLAAADLGVAITCMPFSIVTCLTQTWIFGEALCQFNGFANIVFGMCSLLTLTAISIEKYCAIVKPLHRWITRRRTVTMLAVTWFEPVLFASLPLFGFTRFVYKQGSTQCSVQDPVSLGQTIHAAIVFIIAYVIPLSTMGFAYVKIFKAAGQHNRRIKQNSPNKASGTLSSQAQIAWTVFIMLIVFIICWTPYFVYVIYVTANHGQDSKSRDLALAAYWCVFMNSTLNPFIYGIRNPSFRVEFKNIMLLLTAICDWFKHGRTGSSVASFSVAQPTGSDGSLDVAKEFPFKSNGAIKLVGYHDNKCYIDGDCNHGDDTSNSPQSHKMCGDANTKQIYSNPFIVINDKS